MNNALTGHSSSCAAISSSEEPKVACLEIGHSSPTKVIPIIAIVIFVFGIIAGVVLPDVVQDENRQIKTQLVAAKEHKVETVQR
ncbi:MAG: hypothetical protein CSB48_01870 [Proteobacteria bacterium]|nr:MAG: hypothetical protein CSB48_01870 [Pseudomonadota bacterium]PIE40390.1 MAG: hypothetical protein CSA51_00920 [Gammaproteobacteria bacterium]